MAVSCWNNPGFPATSVIHSHGEAATLLSNHIDDFCISKKEIQVTLDQPLARNWTIGSLGTVEIQVELDATRDSCQSASLDIEDGDLYCQTHLDQILHGCDVLKYVVRGEETGGVLLADDCSLWTLAARNPDYSSESRALGRKCIQYMRDLAAAYDDFDDDNDGTPVMTDQEFNSNFKGSFRNLPENWQPMPDPVDTYAREVMGETIDPAEDSFYFMDVTVKRNQDLIYQNYLSPKYGVIIAAHNVGRDDFSVPSVAPARWWEVIWYFWTKATVAKKVALDDLKYIVQSTVYNPEAGRVLEEAAKRAGKFNIDPSSKRTPLITWTRSDPDLFIVLATQVGKGVAYLLKTYLPKLGKTVGSVKTFMIEGGTWEVVFILEDITCENLLIDDKVVQAFE